MKTIYHPLSSNYNKAFTLLELVFVIVVLGIIAALALPRLDRDIRQEAGDNILSAIRYTKLLALTDDKTNPRQTDWQKSLWAIRFAVSTTDTSATYYTIATDTNRNGSIQKSESAIDPYTGQYLFNSSGSFASRATDESPNIFIGHHFGIKNILFSGGCTNSNKHIAFDHFGRPHTGIGSASNDFSTYIKQDCLLTFKFTDTSIQDLQIKIEKQTGHAYIVGQPDS
jgi:prepilin-type N-terminal cleavage/methylation domain-containing protein